MLREILREEIPSLEDYDASLVDLAIDSFGLVTLRARIEQAIGRTIRDECWSSVETPNDILALALPVSKTEPPESGPPLHSEHRRFSINMPQMAMSGLSESWLLKELGDFHWSRITQALRTPSSSISDGEGNRLYATFTRIAYSFYLPLISVRENDRLLVRSIISRTGSGTFTLRVEFEGLTGGIGSGALMSNFSRRGGQSNSSLLKGQPQIPADCEVPDEPRTAFARAYQDRRSRTTPPVKFECEYEIIPFHDINGVGLLYFAAYPIISDICAMKYREDLAARYSTTARDIYYFNNANPDDTLIFRVHKWDLSENAINMETSIARKSDGLTVAYILTSKGRV